MRLLHARQRKMFEFSLHKPPYAILSHTWGSDEITFETFINCTYNRDSDAYRKVDGCCRQALRDGLEYVWIDTLCIDKRNIVEISEAINSMFRWYRESSVCYAYLADVTDKALDIEETETALHNSRWFTRGWTLQELLAPNEVVFFTKSWAPLSRKHQISDLLSNITNIPVEYLTTTAPLHHASVAQRMSWAAHRETTREEDVAYCLLGIFGVNMALLYGEGSSAFLRLQEEILRQTDDQSLLAWGYGLGPGSLYERWTQLRTGWSSCPVPPSTDERRNALPLGVFARHPLAFAGCGRLIRCSHLHGQVAGIWVYSSTDSLSVYFHPLRFLMPWRIDGILSRYTGSSMEMTSRGLRVDLPLVQVAHTRQDTQSQYALLSCRSEDDSSHLIGIPVMSCGNEYARLQCYDVEHTPIHIRPILISQKRLIFARRQTCHLLRDQEIVVFKQMQLEHRKPVFIIKTAEYNPFLTVRVTPSDLWTYREGRVQLTRRGVHLLETKGCLGPVDLCCHFFRYGEDEAHQNPPAFELLISYEDNLTKEGAPSFCAVVRRVEKGVQQSPTCFLLDDIVVHLSTKIRMTLQGEVYIVRLSSSRPKSQIYDFYQVIEETMRELWSLFRTDIGATWLIDWLRPNNGVFAVLIALLIYSIAFLFFLRMIILGLWSLATIAFYLSHLTGLGLFLTGSWGFWRSPWFLCVHALGVMCLLCSFTLAQRMDCFVQPRCGCANCESLKLSSRLHFRRYQYRPFFTLFALAYLVCSWIGEKDEDIREAGIFRS